MQTNAGKKMFSLRRGILRILMVGMAALLILSGAMLAYTAGTYRRKIDEDNLGELRSSAESLSGDIEMLRNAVGAIYSVDGIVQSNYVRQTEAERWNRVYNAQNLLKLQMQTNDRIGGLMLYYDDVSPTLYYIHKSVSYRNQDLLIGMGKADDSQSFMVNTAIVRGQEDSFYYISMRQPGAKVSGFVSLGRYLTDHPEGQAAYGFLVDGTFYPIHGSGQALENLDTETLASGRNKAGARVIYLQNVPASNIAVLKIVQDSLWGYIGGIQIALMAAILLLILLFQRLIRFAFHELSVPLVDMKETLGHLQGGVWDVDFQAPNRIQEIEDVRQTVNVMLKEIEQYKVLTYEEQMERQQTQLQYCQLQLAPHFYTNCLKNAYYMLAMREYETLERFLMCLSSHLRYLLQPDKLFVTVREERMFVENYIELQRQLSQKDITCNIEVDRRTEELEVPILALQTFVENSVKYARNGKRDSLSLWIRVVYLESEEGDRLNISIGDNGEGYPREVLDILNSREPSTHEEAGIGIINLQKRCRFHYGGEASWGFLNMEGAVSEIILPVRKGEGQ